MAFAPALGSIGGIRTGLITAVHRAYGTTVHDGPRPINLVVASEPIQEREVDQIRHTRQLPNRAGAASTSSPTRTQFLREHLPGNTAAHDDDNAGEARAIRDARSPTLWPSWRKRQERFDKVPQRIWK